MKISLLPSFFGLLLLAFLFSCGKGPDVDKIPVSVVFFEGPVEEALEKARLEDKKIYVVAYTNWCKYCKVLFKGTLADPEVGEYMNRHFISLKINMESGEGRKWAREWDVRAFPTSMILDDDGNVEMSQAGALKKEDFLAFVKKAG